MSEQLNLAAVALETAGLSPEELGVYMRLVLSLHARGGVLPHEPARLARIAGVNEKAWAGLWMAIGHLFVASATEIAHAATTRALAKQKQARARASAMAAARWAKKPGRGGSGTGGGGNGQSSEPKTSPEQGQAAMPAAFAAAMPEAMPTACSCACTQAMHTALPAASAQALLAASPEHENREVSPTYADPLRPSFALALTSKGGGGVLCSVSGSVPLLQPQKPDQTRRRARGKAGASSADDIRRVFDHYRTHHPRAMRNPQAESLEWRRIAARLVEGSTVDELCRAIDGYHRSPWHCGVNDTGAKYLDLALIMRDGTHVERGLAFADDPHIGVMLNTSTRRTLAATSSWAAKQDEIAVREATSWMDYSPASGRG